MCRPLLLIPLRSHLLGEACNNKSGCNYDEKAGKLTIIIIPVCAHVGYSPNAKCKLNAEVNTGRPDPEQGPTQVEVQIFLGGQYDAADMTL